MAHCSQISPILIFEKGRLSTSSFNATANARFVIFDSAKSPPPSQIQSVQTVTARPYGDTPISELAPSTRSFYRLTARSSSRPF